MSLPSGYHSSNMSSSQSPYSSGNPTPLSAVPTSTPPTTPINSNYYPTPQQVQFGYGYASHHHGHEHADQHHLPYYPYYQDPTYLQQQQWNQPLYPHYSYPYYQPQISQHHPPISHSQNSQEISGKQRARLTDAQSAILEAQFEQSRYIVASKCTELSKATGLLERQVSVWFKNRRRKLKKNIQRELDNGHDHSHDHPNPDYQDPMIHQHQPQNYPHQPISHSENLQEDSRKKRVSSTDEELAVLEAQFKQDKYISIRKCVEVSKATGLSERQIRIWFQNKRARKNIQNELGNGHDHSHHQHSHQPQNSHEQPSSHSQYLQPVLKKRVLFTDEQLAMLEERFEKEKFVIGSDRDELAQITGLSKQQIRVWFQNKRYGTKRCMQEENEKKIDEENDN